MPAKKRPSARGRRPRKPKPKFGFMIIPEDARLVDHGYDAIIDGGDRDIDSLAYWKTWDEYDDE